jgi:hypothetical protein
MHSPPKGHLDFIDIPPLTGCAVQARKISEAKPMLCVFGHYHSSWGVERGYWQEGSHLGQNGLMKKSDDVSASGQGLGQTIEAPKHGETVFVNAAWMTMQKTKVQRRNPPFVVKLQFDV